MVRTELIRFAALFSLCLAIVSCGKAQSGAGPGPGTSSTHETKFRPSNFSVRMALNDKFALASVSRAYIAILQREGDEGGLAAHSNHVRRLGVMGWLESISIFTESDEFKEQILAHQSNRDILEALYLGFLRRPLDPVGAKAYLSMIKKGKISQVAIYLATSDEYLNRLYPFTTFTEESYESAVAKTYLALLGRNPNESELTEAKQNNGVTLRGIYDLIERLASGSDLIYDSLVERLYQRMLNRPATRSEFMHAETLIKNGDVATATLDLVLTQEFFQQL